MPYIYDLHPWILERVELGGEKSPPGIEVAEIKVRHEDLSHSAVA